MSNLRHIDVVPKSNDCKEVCLTCPMAKFATLPYEFSDSHVGECFELCGC